MKKKLNYEPPMVKVSRVVLETGIAQTGVPVSFSVNLCDWEEGGEIGGGLDDGGDIHMFY